MSYLNAPFFNGITPDEYKQIVDCFKPEIRHYKSGNTICSFDGHSDFIGIVRFGEISVFRNDINGIRTVLETQSSGGVFGEIFYRTDRICDLIFVICEKDCEIMFIDYHKIAGRCEKACAHHTKLVENMLGLLAQKAINLSQRIDILSRRTTRDKLMSYFVCSCPHGKQSFTLPLSYSALADYLCVDRSAMMREVKKLKDDGIIKTQKREITLIKEPDKYPY